MKIAHALAYTPIVHAGISPDGSRVHVVVPQYDARTSSRPLKLFTVQLQAGSSWTAVGHADATFHSPSWAPDSRRLVAFRSHDGVRDAVVFDLEGEHEPTSLGGMPSGCMALKWWGHPGQLMGIGEDADRCRRVFVWRDLGKPPEGLSPHAGTLLIEQMRTMRNAKLKGMFEHTLAG